MKWLADFFCWFGCALLLLLWLVLVVVCYGGLWHALTGRFGVVLLCLDFGLFVAVVVVCYG